MGIQQSDNQMLATNPMPNRVTTTTHCYFHLHTAVAMVQGRVLAGVALEGQEVVLEVVLGVALGVVLGVVLEAQEDQEVVLGVVLEAQEDQEVVLGVALEAQENLDVGQETLDDYHP